ncbi:MBL fold metallo-hydrolase [Putridiphycobacter roseus]|uniref:MBL fold metallo-hydrolase n=1 Tax=Putridiphycobacter roseus TaxID=2219161 RepID=A0A2W1N4P4_9FLAO|nr:MBL fold metallo-hydrolase RNA specificity domain-containing protein [Putridiphycobacter roseus]PZE18784.1 MBL fold metallo-hydrolase [Putridiphycobacter roseus]
MKNKGELSLHFLGGAGTVTGSKTLITTKEDSKVLVDCGLFQGLKKLRTLNRQDLPVHAAEIEALILTHAHLDHSGYIPALVKNGFKGKIHCTQPTRDLTEIILLDSAKIQEEDAERANKYGYGKHEKCEPLYTQKDAALALQHFVVHDYSEWVILTPSVKFQMHNAGHIIGSAIVEVKADNKTIVFSGDIGRKDPMLMYPPKKIKHADYIIIESTYGDRIHEKVDEKAALLKIINDTFKRKGILMIPAFAVERTQELIYLLHALSKENLLPNMPIYLDSPMAVRTSIVFDKFHQLQDISKQEADHMYDNIKFVPDYKFSQVLVADKKPKIIIAGSGMLEGGRMLHYLNAHGENPNNTILFVGFQAEGTRGRDLLTGNKSIKFFGDYHAINCHIENITSMSSHGDKNDLLNWLSNFKEAPKTIFLNHGEPHQTNAFRVWIETKLKWQVKIPVLNEKVILD